MLIQHAWGKVRDGDAVPCHPGGELAGVVDVLGVGNVDGGAHEQRREYCRMAQIIVDKMAPQ